MAHTLFTQKDAFGITQLTMWTARTGFIAAEPRRAGRFPRRRGPRRSAGTPIRRITTKPSPSSRGSTRRRRRAWTGPLPAAINIAIPNGMPNLERAAEQPAAAEGGRFPQRRYRRKKYSDVSMVEEAAKRLHENDRACLRRARHQPIAAHGRYASLRPHRAADRRHRAVHGEHGLDGDRDLAAGDRARARHQSAGPEARGHVLPAVARHLHSRRAAGPPTASARATCSASPSACSCSARSAAPRRTRSKSSCSRASSRAWAAR